MTNFFTNRVLFGVFFFPKSCLKVLGAAYTRVRLIHESLRYFASLRERHVYQSKRGSQGEIIKVGDVVLMHAENVPRSSWKLAIVKKVLRGSDGLVRAAEIKTNSGVTNRSIHLLYPLEVTLTDPKEHFTGTELQIPQVETLRRSKRIASRPRPQYVESGD